MASHIHVTADKEADVSKGDVYEALHLVGSDQLSKQSPVTAQLREAAVGTSETTLTVHVEGHEGEWSRTSQNALLGALHDLDGVRNARVVDGGYDEDTEADADDARDVESISGVGPDRADTLRAAGIETVDDVLEGGVEALVEAGISPGVAENIVERA